MPGPYIYDVVKSYFFDMTHLRFEIELQHHGDPDNKTNPENGIFTLRYLGEDYFFTTTLRNDDNTKEKEIFYIFRRFLSLNYKFVEDGSTKLNQTDPNSLYDYGAHRLIIPKPNPDYNNTYSSYDQNPYPTTTWYIPMNFYEYFKHINNNIQLTFQRRLDTGWNEIHVNDSNNYINNPNYTDVDAGTTKNYHQIVYHTANPDSGVFINEKSYKVFTDAEYKSVGTESATTSMDNMVINIPLPKAEVKDSHRDINNDNFRLKVSYVPYVYRLEDLSNYYVSLQQKIDDYKKYYDETTAINTATGQMDSTTGQSKYEYGFTYPNQAYYYELKVEPSMMKIDRPNGKKTRVKLYIESLLFDDYDVPYTHPTTSGTNAYLSDTPHHFYYSTNWNSQVATRNLSQFAQNFALNTDIPEAIYGLGKLLGYPAIIIPVDEPDTDVEDIIKLGHIDFKPRFESLNALRGKYNISIPDGENYKYFPDTGLSTSTTLIYYEIYEVDPSDNSETLDTSEDTHKKIAQKLVEKQIVYQYDISQYPSLSDFRTYRNYKFFSMDKVAPLDYIVHLNLGRNEMNRLWPSIQLDQYNLHISKDPGSSFNILKKSFEQELFLELPYIEERNGVFLNGKLISTQSNLSMDIEIEYGNGVETKKIQNVNRINPSEGEDNSIVKTTYRITSHKNFSVILLKINTKHLQSGENKIRVTKIKQQAVVDGVFTDIPESVITEFGGTPLKELIFTDINFINTRIEPVNYNDTTSPKSFIIENDSKNFYAIKDVSISTSSYSVYSIAFRIDNMHKYITDYGGANFYIINSAFKPDPNEYGWQLQYSTTNGRYLFYENDITDLNDGLGLDTDSDFFYMPNRIYTIQSYVTEIKADTAYTTDIWVRNTGKTPVDRERNPDSNTNVNNINSYSKTSYGPYHDGYEYLQSHDVYHIYILKGFTEYNPSYRFYLYYNTSDKKWYPNYNIVTNSVDDIPEDVKEALGAKHKKAPGINAYKNSIRDLIEIWVYGNTQVEAHLMRFKDPYDRDDYEYNRYGVVPKPHALMWKENGGTKVELKSVLTGKLLISNNILTKEAFTNKTHKFHIAMHLLSEQQKDSFISEEFNFKIIDDINYVSDFTYRPLVSLSAFRDRVFEFQVTNIIDQSIKEIIDKFSLYKIKIKPKIAGSTADVLYTYDYNDELQIYEKDLDASGNEQLIALSENNDFTLYITNSANVTNPSDVEKNLIEGPNLMKLELKVTLVEDSPVIYDTSDDVDNTSTQTSVSNDITIKTFKDIQITVKCENLVSCKLQ